MNKVLEVLKKRLMKISDPITSGGRMPEKDLHQHRPEQLMQMSADALSGSKAGERDKMMEQLYTGQS